MPHSFLPIETALPVVSRPSEGTRLSNSRGFFFFMSSSFGDHLMLQFDEGLGLASSSCSNMVHLLLVARDQDVVAMTSIF